MKPIQTAIFKTLKSVKLLPSNATLNGERKVPIYAEAQDDDLPIAELLERFRTFVQDINISTYLFSHKDNPQSAETCSIIDDHLVHIFKARNGVLPVAFSLNSNEYDVRARPLCLYWQEYKNLHEWQSLSHFHKKKEEEAKQGEIVEVEPVHKPSYWDWSKKTMDDTEVAYQQLISKELKSK